MKTTIFRLSLLALVSSNAAIAQDVRPYLTLDAARVGAEACEQYALESDLKVAVSVKDRGGRLVYFHRMDDVFQKQIEFAGIKAETAATTPLSTKRLAEVAKPDTALAGLVYVPGLNGVEGGEPIKLEGGYSLGGVGVSGASPAQDGNCARAAVTAITVHYTSTGQ